MILCCCKLPIIGSWERVRCIPFFCRSMAAKAGRTTLRYNTRAVLIFANEILSQQWIHMLQDFVFTPLHWLVLAMTASEAKILLLSDHKSMVASCITIDSYNIFCADVNIRNVV